MLKEPAFLFIHESEHIGGLLVLIPHVSAFKAIDKIINDCCSNIKLGGNLHMYITEDVIYFVTPKKGSPRNEQLRFPDNILS